MSKFELPISQDYVKGWTIVEAVREFFQNALDQETVEPDNKMFWFYDMDTQHLQIGNRFSILDTSSLVIGATTKADNTDTIGQFGEGYKIATLVALREGYNVVIQNYGCKETWTARMIDSRKYKQKILAFDVAKSVFTSVPDNNLTIDIWPVTLETFNHLKQYNLHLCAREPIALNKHNTELGNVLQDDKAKGLIFVNGLYVAKNAYLAYGYDLPPKKLKLDRDRRLVGDFDIAWATSAIWREIGATAASLALVKNPNMLDCKYLSYGITNASLCTAITTDFISEYGDKAIPVQTQQEVDTIKATYKDAVPVIVTDSQQRIIESNELFKPNVTAATPGPTFEEQIATWFIEFKDGMSIETIRSIYEIYKTVGKKDMLQLDDEQAVAFPEPIDDMDCDALKHYCRVEGPASCVTPTGYSSCEGSFCREAYNKYIECWQVDNDVKLKCKHCAYWHVDNTCASKNDYHTRNELICDGFNCRSNEQYVGDCL